MHLLPQDIYIRKQANEPQPNIILLTIIFYLVSYSLTHISKLLVKTDTFSAFVSNNYSTYLCTFFVIHFVLHLLAIIILMPKYRSSLGLIRTKAKTQRMLLAIIVLLPLVGWYFSDLLSFFSSLKNLISVGEGDQFKVFISELHNRVWSQVAYGPTLSGVVCFTIMFFVTPFFEEIMITGFLNNYICRRTNLLWALAITPVFFAMSHIMVFGFGFHLLPLLWQGYCYVLIRFLTGNIIYSIGAHLLVNLMIFIPKWTIAYLYFNI